MALYNRAIPLIFYTLKPYFFILILLLFVLTTKGQSFEARYKVLQDVEVNIDTKILKVTTLESTGFFYKKNNQYIYYEKPNYLKKYPDGVIITSITPEHQLNLSLCMDTIQRINYTAMDSLVLRNRVDMGGKGNVDFNYVQKFELNVFNWVFQTETKEIQGLKCQKATLSINGNPEWSVWFCPDIPLQAGISNILDLPGLVVEAENIPTKTYYYLDYYTTTTNIDDNVFWPKEFLQRFETLPDRKRRNGSTPKTKTQKQVELLNQ